MCFILQLLEVPQLHNNMLIFCLYLIVYYNSTTHEHVGKHLVTCPDCILWIDTSVTEGKDRETIKGRTVYLFSEFTAFLHTNM